MEQKLSRISMRKHLSMKCRQYTNLVTRTPKEILSKLNSRGNVLSFPNVSCTYKIKLFICLGVNGKSGFLVEKELVHHQQEHMMWMARRIRELEDKLTDDQVNF